jgi:Rps23 Pro-64 3,4-dihydroxylase Tpa1-like proline 4-hydroxylase
MKIMYSKHKNELLELGYTVIDDFLPIDVAKQIHDLFIQDNSWQFIYQIREKHYDHVHKTESPFLPKGDEMYLSKFSRSFILSENEELKKLYEEHFVPKLKIISPFELNEFDVRCHRMDGGNYFRTHIDDYAGSINLIYYVNEKWMWDWGGMLNIADDRDYDFNKQILPRFNRVTLLNNKVFRSPHFVSSVEEYAQYPRYSIVSFNK